MMTGSKQCIISANENGFYKFKLQSLIYSKNSNKNKLSVAKAIDFNTIQRMCHGDLTRIDLNIVARICDYYNCKIEDVIEYFPNQEYKK